MGTFHTRCTEYYLTISLYQHVYNVCVPGASTLVDAVCNWRLLRLQPSGDLNAGEPPRCLISGPAARRPGHLDQPAGPAHRRTGPCAEVVPPCRWTPLSCTCAPHFLHATGFSTGHMEPLLSFTAPRGETSSSPPPLACGDQL
jgi:hypothetical protein